jgi:YVTN family beta-propeller protein
VRPDGNEVWVANHVSDSVSVIDTDPASSSLHQVVETVQEVVSQTDPTTPLVTNFDEPVGIAFASNSKAYVALSSRDQIAVVDASTYTVTNQIDVNAQEPRAIKVRDGRLYVLPFESGNQSELAACPRGLPGVTINDPPNPGDQCTFDLADVPQGFAINPNMTDTVVDLVVDPDLPDRDLYVYDASNDSLMETVDGIGTLLYGLAVDSSGKVFVSMTDARNHENGQAGTSGQGLDDLQNRMFLNQLGRVDCTRPIGSPCTGPPTSIDLEEAPGSGVTEPLATPYGIQISDDDSTLIVTAAASSRIFSFDAGGSGMNDVLDTLDVGAIPRGVALRSDPTSNPPGAPQTAYVLNTLDNSVSVVNVGADGSLSAAGTISLPGDPTPADVRLGRIAFNDANASDSGTFACASCHPDGNTDQLLWVIGATCDFTGCDQEELRSTMSVRGLRDTLPLHWDGVLGDPFGGTNGEVDSDSPLGLGQVTVPPNCGPNGGGGNCFRQLVDASLSGVMCNQVPSCANGPSGLPGRLTAAERVDMATFLELVSYPPARSRRPDDVLTAEAVSGFDDFFFDQGGNAFGPDTCADMIGGCHTLPFLTGTNSNFVGGFDAPTMRGITDRWLQFSAGVTNVEENLVGATLIGGTDVPWSATLGFDERAVWALAFGSASVPGAFRNVYNVGPFEVFQMIEEMSTGYSGAQGRQVTLNTQTTSGGELAQTEAIMTALENADSAGLVNLRGSGLRGGNPITYSFTDAGLYETRGLGDLTRAELIAEAQAGTTMLTLTAALRPNVGKENFPPPALSVGSVGSNPLTEGRLDLPVLPGDNPMNVRGLHVRPAATILVDGQPVSGTITCLTGGFAPDCPANILNPGGRNLDIGLDAIPSSGLHLLQLQTPKGQLSNELPFTVQ